MFYERFAQLCAQRGIAPSRAATEAGLSKSTVTKWKTYPDLEPSGSAIKKLSQYFGITRAELLGEDRAPARRPLSDAELKFALFNGDRDITDDMLEDVKRYAEFVKEKYKK